MAMHSIKDICTLFSGFPLSAESFVREGNAYAIQSGTMHRSPPSILGYDEIEGVEPSGISFRLEVGEDRPKYGLSQVDIPDLAHDKHILEHDVLFRARSASFDGLEAFAPLIRNTIKDKPYIVSNSFIVLRPITDDILPKYLEWALNNFREGLRKYARGSNIIHAISINDLKEVRLPIPDMKSQESIIATVQEVENFRTLYKALKFSTQKMLRGVALQHSQGDPHQ